jgi:hypothetical protein
MGGFSSLTVFIFNPCYFAIRKNKIVIKKLGTNIPGLVTAIVLISCSELSFARPASAITVEEFLRMMGIMGRYSEDIRRTFPERFGPPPTENNMPNPAPTNTPMPTQDYPEFNPAPPNTENILLPYPSY